MRAQLEIFFTREWRRSSGWQILLQPFAWLFMAVTASRRYLYRHGQHRQHRLCAVSNFAVPVIVIGNISVGGTGKTPLVIALSRALADRGRIVGIVTRGYARHGSHSGDAAPASDEAILLGQRGAAPVVADARRVAAVEQLLTRYPATNVVIADDGLQHYALARDIEIAVVDGARGFGNGYRLPAGPLRESIARLKSVDCIVVNNTNLNASADAHPTLADLPDATGKPVFSMTYGLESFIPLAHQQQQQQKQQQKFSVEPFHHFAQGKRIAAVAGIGHPERFFTHLESLGMVLHSRHAFADHHPFVARDLDKIDADLILMTEKDAVKCAGLVLLAASRVWQMQVDALLPDAFYDFIAAKLEKISHVT